MPIQAKLKDVDEYKVRDALTKAEMFCEQCDLKGTVCERCYIDFAIRSLRSFLSDEVFSGRVDFALLKQQPPYTRNSVIPLMLSTGLICLKCGIKHIDDCFINLALQALQLAALGKIVERSYFF
jgi:hypothetical protein